jgi:hypothetical protein
MDLYEEEKREDLEDRKIDERSTQPRSQLLQIVAGLEAASVSHPESWIVEILAHCQALLECIVDS